MTRRARGKPTTVARQTSGRSSRKRLEPKAAGRVRGRPPNWFLLNPILQEAGVYVNSETASQVAAVYGCCRLIVDCLAPAPIHVTELSAGGVRNDRPDDPVAWTLNYGAPVAQAPDAPTAQAIEEALYWSALLGDGNGYAEIQRDMSGRFFAMWPIESDRVTPKRDESGFYYEVRQPSDGVARVEAVDMFHLRGPSLKGWVGDSLVYRAAKAIGIAHASQVFSAAYFANGTVLSGLLTSDKLISRDQAKEAKGRWLDDHGGGPGRAHGISVLGAGVKYQPINHNARDSMLIEARRFQVQEIARFFGVPTTLLADNEAWTNLGELYLGFYRNALRPWAERFDAEASRKLFPQRQPWREVSHDLTHLTMGSFKDQVQALTQATGGKPILTQNESRAYFGKNSVDGGDELAAPAQPPTAAQPKQGPPEPDGGDPEDTPGQAQKNDQEDQADPEAVARAAASVFYGQALERHQKRVANGMDESKSLVKLKGDCDAAAAFLARAGLRGPNGALEQSAAAVITGQPPETVAEQLAGALERA